MATGYTSQLTSNPKMSFAEFAMTCARAFGALVEMRDEPLGAKIPTTIKPSDYHAKALCAAYGKKGRFKQLTRGQKVAQANAAMLDSMRRALNRLDEAKKTAEIYTSMMAKVQAWNPPTPEHANLKKFMLEQLQSSLDFDCNESYTLEELARLQKQTPKEWLAKHVEHLQWEVDYHRKENAEEIKRCAGRTAWIQALVSSLGLNDTPAVKPSVMEGAYDSLQREKGEASLNPLMSKEDNARFRKAERNRKLGKVAKENLLY